MISDIQEKRKRETASFDRVKQIYFNLSSFPKNKDSSKICQHNFEKNTSFNNKLNTENKI